jgi:hypothetical protein
VTASLRAVRTVLICSVLALTPGCKGKPKHQETPTKVETGSAAAKGSGVLQPAPDLVLPKSAGGPPTKTAKPLVKADFEKLEAMTFPGFQMSPRVMTDKYLELRQTTEDHPKIASTLSVEPCFDCPAMDLAKWKERTEALKAHLVPELRALPDTVFEVGQVVVGGQPMIYTYQLAQTPPGEHWAFSEAYVLYYNDGVNSIKVVSEYKDDPVKTKEDMAKLVPKADLENIAKAFMDVYSHAW